MRVGAVAPASKPSSNSPPHQPLQLLDLDAVVARDTVRRFAFLASCLPCIVPGFAAADAPSTRVARSVLSLPAQPTTQSNRVAPFGQGFLPCPRPAKNHTNKIRAG